VGLIWNCFWDNEFMAVGCGGWPWVVIASKKRGREKVMKNLKNIYIYIYVYII